MTVYKQLDQSMVLMRLRLLVQTHAHVHTPKESWLLHKPHVGPLKGEVQTYPHSWKNKSAYIQLIINGIFFHMKVIIIYLKKHMKVGFAYVNIQSNI